MIDTTAALPELAAAAKSDIFETVATIAGGKAHKVSARTLLEDATVREHFFGNKYRTRTVAAGTVLYYGTRCGTARHTKNWAVYANSYRPADEITCAKCAA